MFWLKVVAAVSIWEDAFKNQPNPGVRDLDSRDYFVIEASDPNPIATAHNWVTEEPFPISDHWLMSSNTSEHSIKKRELDAYALGARNFYPSEPSKLRRRAPLPVHPTFKSVTEEFHITDPLFKDQWFIFNTEEPGHDMNVLPVWRRNITGKGVTVAIVDDGLDYDHPDFSDTFSLDGSWDYNLHQQHPKPLLSEDTHGTRCAGEVAAGINNACGIGIAPGSKVSGIRILSGGLTNSDEARALIHRYDVNDIYSCSWGPNDDGLTIDGPPPIVKRAEVDGIENGRHGKGSIYVVASGNGDIWGDNCNYDGYTNSIYSITIGAIDRQNKHPYYAESCSANMVVTYSSNYYDKITTSDRLDPMNPEEVKCTSSHSGTSAAAPIAAGVFALVLEQRPDLTWRDLQYLVRDTAQHFDITPAPKSKETADWMTTADGHYYHNSYGYGLLDADAIVRRAETWELVKPQSWYFLPESMEQHAITPTTETSLELSADQWEEANMDHIEHVRVRVSYEHEARGELSFKLVSPAGIESNLASPRKNDVSSVPVYDWEFLSVVHWNETGTGVWKLKVTGPEHSHGVLLRWQLKLFGQAKDLSKVKRYSESWNEYEKPASLVKDPFNNHASTSEIEQSPTATGEQSSTTTVQSETSTTESSITEVPSSDVSITEPSSTTTETTPTSQESDTPVYDAVPTSPLPSDIPVTHSLVYYIVVSIVGIIVIGLIFVPIIYFGFWKRKQNVSYVHLEDEEFDLDDMNDNFEIDDEDLEEEYVPAEPTSRDM